MRQRSQASFSRARPGVIVGMFLVASCAALLSLTFFSGDGEHPESGTSWLDSTTVPEHPLGAPVALLGAGAHSVRTNDIALAVESWANSLKANELGVHGKVVDESGRGVGNCVVDIDVESREHSAISDSAGRVEISLPMPDRASPLVVTVRGTCDDGRAGATSVLITPHPWQRGPGSNVRDFGLLVLKRQSVLTVLVSGPGDDVPVSVQAMGAATAPVVTTVARGLANRPLRLSLPSDTYRLVASADGWGRGVAGIRVARATSDPLVIALDPTPVELEVRVRNGETHEPVTGARVRVYESVSWKAATRQGVRVSTPPMAPTDEEGRTFLPDIGQSDTLVLHAEAPGYAPAAAAYHGSGVKMVRMSALMGRGRRPVVTIDLRPGRDFRWTIERNGQEPAEGTRLELVSGLGAPPSQPDFATLEDGQVVVRGTLLLPVDLSAVAPNGVIARLVCRSDHLFGGQTVFSSPRSLEVRLSHAGGTPVAGIPVEATVGPSRPAERKVVTNENGVARFTGLPAGTGRLYISPPDPGLPWYGDPIGSFDLTVGDARIAVTIPGPQVIAIRSTLDGHPAIPEQASLVLSGRVATPRAQDADRGLILLDWQPGGRPWSSLVFRAPGYLASTVLIESSPAGRVVTHVAWQHAGRIRAQVQIPAGYAPMLRTQVWKASRGRWVTGGPGVTPVSISSSVAIDPSGTAEVGDLPPGRYRLIDAKTGRFSEPVQFDSTGGEASVGLDLRGIWQVRGFIVTADGEAVSGASVRIVDSEAPSPVAERVVAAWPDGSFYVTLFGGRPVMLEARHPSLVAHRRTGRVRIQGNAANVALTLVEARRAELILRFASKQDGATGPVPRRVRVLLHAQGGGVQVKWARRTELTGGYEFGGFESGNYDVWIDAPPYAPDVVERARLSVGLSSLGPIAMDRGFSIVVRRAGPRLEGKYVEVRAEGSDPFPHVRTGWSRGPAVEVPGLGPGKYVVHAMVDGVRTDLGTVDVLDREVRLFLR